MPMEGQIKFFSPQNTAGVLQEKGVAVTFLTIEANGDQVSKKPNKQTNKKNLMVTLTFLKTTWHVKASEHLDYFG